MLISNTYKQCYQQAVKVFQTLIPYFDESQVMISRNWSMHMSYVLPPPEVFDASAKYSSPEIECIQLDGIYLNIRFSMDFLFQFFQTEQKRSTAFSAPSSCSEDELFSTTYYTACRLHDVSHFPSWSGFSHSTLVDILWRIYVFDGLPITAYAKYNNFFCKSIQEILDTPNSYPASQKLQSMSCSVAELAARRLRDILLILNQ